MKTLEKKTYTALIMDIMSKNNSKKVGNNLTNINVGNNSNYVNNNTEEDDIYLVLLIPEL